MTCRLISWRDIWTRESSIARSKEELEEEKFVRFMLESESEKCMNKEHSFLPSSIKWRIRKSSRALIFSDNLEKVDSDSLSRRRDTESTIQQNISHNPSSSTRRKVQESCREVIWTEVCRVHLEASLRLASEVACTSMCFERFPKTQNHWSKCIHYSVQDITWTVAPESL